ncbi:hypothetical protein NOV72_02621 [Caballeronia novacaledonica]|uniref:Uncharacterized protein n=1 Tax=Caballeronia novacaledonica TaxID=1544861 RepID=A0A2U3I5H2_9BURK|nr:Imm52 family immunity protein [Caballeronia novacaledonica]SPB15395.1 hypothetical protein NOV72_02621 [Caballeronia novacaledonica]
MNVDISFKENVPLPSVYEQYHRLWKLALVLEKIGVNLEAWYWGNDAEEGKPPTIKAFSHSGPREEMLEAALKNNESDLSFLHASVWNGIEGPRGIACISTYMDTGLSTFKLQSQGFAELRYYHKATELLEGALQIWPALIVELGPFKYYSMKQVFPDRPGVGWMLYLPRRIEIEQVPEARMIHHVTDLNGTEGTILISEIDGPFDADNPEHVKVANAIEIRLADQDLLPRYADL